MRGGTTGGDLGEGLLRVALSMSGREGRGGKREGKGEQYIHTST